MEDKISVIIPVYNAQNYIEKSVNSIINQTYSNLEIILIDDGSTDESYKIMKKLKDKDSRIKIFSRENKGTLYTRLEGVDIATGEYIMYVDSDDYIEFDMISKLFANGNNVDIVRCDYTVENMITNIKKKDSNFFTENTILKKEDFKDLYYIYLTTYQYSGICAQLIKRKLLENVTFKKSVNMCEDLYINLELISQANSIAFVPKGYYHYIIRENSTCTNLDKCKMKKRISDSIYIYFKFFEYIKKWNIENNETKTLVANRIIKEAFYQIKNLFFVSYTKQEIIQILNEVLDCDEFDKARMLADKNKLAFFEKKLYRKQYNTFYQIANITIRPIYNMKKILKRVLYK